jgi:hypothetical protein
MIKKKHYYIFFISLLVLKNTNNNPTTEDGHEKNTNEEYQYNIYKLTTSPFNYLPANYFYPDKIIVSEKTTEDNFLHKILSYRIKDKAMRFSYSISDFLFPQLMTTSKLNKILPYQHGRSSFLALALALNIHASDNTKPKSQLKTATIYATGAYENIQNDQTQETEMERLEHYKSKNFRITKIGDLNVKIGSILKHVQDYKVESFLLFLSGEDYHTIQEFIDEIKEDIDYLKNKKSILINNSKNSLESTKKNIILDFFLDGYWKMNDKYYSQLINKNNKAREELITLQNILSNNIGYIENYQTIEFFSNKTILNFVYDNFKHTVNPKTFPYLTELSFTTKNTSLPNYLKNVFDFKNEIELDPHITYFEDYNNPF